MPNLQLRGVHCYSGRSSHVDGFQARKENSESVMAELIVPHCDPNVNLYNHAYCVRGDNIVEVWEVGARGHV